MVTAEHIKSVDLTRRPGLYGFNAVYERGYQISADETPILYDIFIEGEWIGSRRTIKQCEEALRHHVAAP